MDEGYAYGMDKFHGLEKIISVRRPVSTRVAVGLPVGVFVDPSVNDRGHFRGQVRECFRTRVRECVCRSCRGSFH